MEITEFYNEFFSTAHNPKGTDVFEKDYNFRDIIQFAEAYHKKQLNIGFVSDSYFFKGVTISIKEVKRLLDYTNYIKECVSNNTEINKNTIRKYLKGSYYHQPIKL